MLLFPLLLGCCFAAAAGGAAAGGAVKDAIAFQWMHFQLTKEKRQVHLDKSRVLWLNQKFIRKLAIKPNVYRKFWLSKLALWSSDNIQGSLVSNSLKMGF